MTNSDRELLMDAARAAGIELLTQPFLHTRKVEGALTTTGDLWNPLTDDGDALRLAVKLRIGVTPTGVAAYAEPCQPIDGVKVTIAETADMYVATRLAIVRAAAQLWRDKP